MITFNITTHERSLVCYVILWVVSTATQQYHSKFLRLKKQLRKIFVYFLQHGLCTCTAFSVKILVKINYLLVYSLLIKQFLL